MLYFSVVWLQDYLLFLFKMNTFSSHWTESPMQEYDSIPASHKDKNILSSLMVVVADS